MCMSAKMVTNTLLKKNKGNTYTTHHVYTLMNEIFQLKILIHYIVGKKLKILIHYIVEIKISSVKP